MTSDRNIPNIFDDAVIIDEYDVGDKAKLLNYINDLHVIQKSFIALLDVIQHEHPGANRVVDHILAECFIPGSNTKPADILKTYINMNGVAPYSQPKIMRYTLVDGVEHFHIKKKNGAYLEYTDTSQYRWAAMGARELQTMLTKLKITHIEHAVEDSDLSNTTYTLSQWLEWAYKRDLDAEDQRLFRRRVREGEI